MRYFDWLGEITGVEFGSRHFLRKWWMREGSPVQGWDENMVGTYAPERVGLDPGPPRFNFGFAINGWPIASAAMRTFLDTNAPGAVQFLPFRLEVERPRRDLEGYCVCQFLEFVDCLDKRRTHSADSWETTNEFGDFELRTPIVFATANIGDQRLFRVAGYSVCILMREDLRQSMEHAGFTGHNFKTVEMSP
jgi:hypothetical protein